MVLKAMVLTTTVPITEIDLIWLFWGRYQYISHSWTDN